jgi:hypothetical protein
VCKVCKEAFKVSASTFLKNVEFSIKEGADPEHFKDVLDAVLDTEEPETDVDADDAFERSYRNR